MPELPEVETIRRQLAKAIIGKRINQVEVPFSGRINLPVKKFIAAIKGRKIESVDRRAKMLLIGLSGGQTIVIHLKMTGKLLLVEPDHKPGKHTHILFRLSGSRVLFFDDVRKFGYVRLFKTSELDEKVFAPANLGVEPLGDKFTTGEFAKCLVKHARATLKPLLLSQKCVVGLGNIYADETLWQTKIRPDRKAGSLSSSEIKRLHAAIKNILRESIKLGGTSFDSYRDTEDRGGSYVKKLKVYGRDGQKCFRCQNIIKKMRLGGRGTHWCPRCQK